MRRIVSIVLSFVLCVALIPCMAFAEGDSDQIKGIPLDWEGEYDGTSGGVVVRRDYEIHIDSIDDDGAVSGKAIISPSEKADAEYGANGSYLFSGTINLETYQMDMQGYEWIDYPISGDGGGGWDFIQLSGTIDPESGTIEGTSENGIWEMSVINYSSYSGASGFELGRDNNNFVHTDSDDWSGAGFKGLKKYSIDSSYFNTLTKNASDEEKSSLKKYVNEEEWGGSCYGIAVTMGLVYEGHLNVRSICSDDVTSYHSMRYPVDDPKLLNTINYYQLSQSLDYGGAEKAAVASTFHKGFFNKLINWEFNDDSLSSFLRQLVKHALNDEVIVLGASYKGGGHAILVTGCQFDSDMLQYVLTIYDENCVDSSTDNGYFTEMRIAKDYSSFTLDMAGHVINNSSYKSMYFLDMKKLLDLQGNMSFQSILDYTTLIFPAEHDLTITDDFGYTLTVEDGVLSGDMSIYDIRTIETGGESKYLIRTDNYYPFTVTSSSGGVDIDIYNYYGYMAVKGNNISSATIYPGRYTTLSGSNYDFKAYSSTENSVGENESGLVSVSGNAQADTSLTVSSSCIEVRSDADINNMETSALIGVDVKSEKQTAPVKSLMVNSVDGKTSSIPEENEYNDDEYYDDDYPDDSYDTDNRSRITKKTDLKKLTLKKIKAAKKAMTVKWKGISKSARKKIKKVEIQYSTDKKFRKNVKTVYVKSSKSSKMIKGLASKKYYVRIRAYTKSGSVIHLSRWSRRKAVKIR